MTADERAAQITSGWECRTRNGYTALIADAIRTAVLEEREACARVADEAEQRNWDGKDDDTAPEHIAAAIRGRK